MEKKILPFYMTYPAAVYPMDLPMDSPMNYQKRVMQMQNPAQDMGQNEKIMDDLNYFIQLYPAGAKQIQKEVVRALDILDYDGSVIYDEYPDQFQMYRLARDILNAMRQRVWDGENQSEEEAKQLQSLISREDIEDYILLVLFHEILRRRHKKGSSFIHFL